MYLTDMTPYELEAAKKKPLFIPVGSVEFHGNHLPLGTDLYITEGIARAVAEKNDIVIAPSFIYSPTGYAVSGPGKGTVDIGIDLFISYCSEILAEYEKMGFSDIYVLVHHQSDSVISLIRTAVMKMPHSMYNIKNEIGEGWWTDGKSIGKSNIYVCNAKLDSPAFGGHGGRGETEAILALRPQLVHLEKAVPGDYRWAWNESDRVDTANAERARAGLCDIVERWTRRLSKY